MRLLCVWLSKTLTQKQVGGGEVRVCGGGKDGGMGFQCGCSALRLTSNECDSLCMKD